MISDRLHGLADMLEGHKLTARPLSSHECALLAETLRDYAERIAQMELSLVNLKDGN